MPLIRAVLRYYANLSSAISSVFGRIGAGSYLNLLDTFLTRRDNRCTTPRLTIYARSVDLIVICGNPLAIGRNRLGIFGLKDRVIRTAGSA